VWGERLRGVLVAEDAPADGVPQCHACAMRARGDAYKHGSVCDGDAFIIRPAVDGGHAVWLSDEAPRGCGYGFPSVLTPEGVADRVFNRVVSVTLVQWVDGMPAAWRLAGEP
jgi:hypothetical protein